AAAAPFGLRYDATPPSVADVTVVPGDRMATVRWSVSPDTMGVTVTRTAGTKSQPVTCLPRFGHRVHGSGSDRRRSLPLHGHRLRRRGQRGCGLCAGDSDGAFVLAARRRAAHGAAAAGVEAGPEGALLQRSGLATPEDLQRLADDDKPPPAARMDVPGPAIS